MVFDGQIGKYKYEIGAYQSDTLVDLFSTDSKNSLTSLIKEAESQMGFLKNQNPKENYHLRPVTGIKVINRSCF